MLIATIGRNSEPPEIITEMARYFDVFRINGSHIQDVAHLVRLAKLIHEAAPSKPVAYDTCGPETRIGHLPRPITLVSDQVVTVGEGEFQDAGPGQELHVPLMHPQLLTKPAVGQQFVMNDGQVRLVITDRIPSGYRCRVIGPGILPSRKNIMCPDVEVLGSVIAPHEEPYLEVIDRELPWITDIYVSFTQRASDADEVQARFHRPMRRTSKAETRHAVENSNLAHIVQAFESTMVAQGDLLQAFGDELPRITERIIRICVEEGKECIAATGNFRSMMYEPVLPQGGMYLVWKYLQAGVFGFMFSDETVFGKYPIAVGREVRAAIDAYRRYNGFEK